MKLAVSALMCGAVISAIQVFGQVTNQGANQTPEAGGGTGNGAAPGGRRARGLTYAPGQFIPLKAGDERTVVLTGKTYLDGVAPSTSNNNLTGIHITAAQLPEDEKVTWSKVSGPGEAKIENGDKLNATATFDKTGDYVLKVDAKQADHTSEDTVLVHVTDASLGKPLISVPTTDYSLNSPVWDARIKAQICGWIPHCIAYIENPALHTSAGRNGQPNVLGPGGLDNFIEAAKKLHGEPAKAHVGYVFSNAWVHNIMESMCLAEMVDAKGDPDILKAQASMKETINKWIPIILAAQEPDGYIQTAHTLGLPGGRGGDGTPRMWQRWTEGSRGNHEGYTQGYFLESAIAHYYMTKGEDMRMYNAAKKCADCWYDHIGPEPGKQVWYDGHQEMEKALVRFGRLVNDVEGAGKGDKYIQLAKFLLDSRSTGRNPQEYDQSHVPVIKQYQAVGHAVRAAYTYAGMSAVMADTGDLDYQSATLSLWDNIVNKKLYITGGIGSGETSEGFGPDYSLRNNAYCESCSNCGELFFQYNMNLAFKDAKYVSLYEDTLYNAVLGDCDLSGDNFTYTNALVSQGAPSGAAPGQAVRYAWHSCPCCVGNIPRTLLSLPTWAYSVDTDSLYVNLFIGSTMTIPKFEGTSVQMVQQTNYPWDGKVAITVNPKEAKHFALRIAIPDRQVSKLYTETPEVSGISGLSVNGTAIASPTIDKGYAIIDRDWKAGDKVQFEVPLKPQVVTADKRIAADEGRVALRYGPLVYNIESVDGNNTTGGLAKNAPISADWKPSMLQGVMVLHGKFSDGQELTAIPNYVRSNRGGASMVWMTEAAQATP